MKFQLSILSLLIAGSISHTVSANNNQNQLSSEICRVFPRVAQSHQNNGVLTIRDTAFILQESAAPFELGFARVESSNPSSCSTGTATFTCRANVNQVVSPLAKIELKESITNVTVRPTESITLGEGGICQKTKDCVYQDLEINNGTLNLESGEYWFRDIRLLGSASLRINGRVKIYAKRFVMEQSKASIVQKAQPNDFQLLVKGDIQLKGSSKFDGLLYSESSITLSDQVELTGAVTAANVTLTDKAKIIGESECFTPMNYVIQLEPKFDTANACSRIPVSLSVTDSIGVPQAVRGSFRVMANSGVTGDACWAESPQGSCAIGEKEISTVNGQATLWLEKKSSGTVNVHAAFLSDKTGAIQVQGAKYIFQPGGFQIMPQESTELGAAKMIAGKPQQFSIRAMSAGCGSMIDTTYDGKKRLVIEPANYISPPLSRDDKYTKNPVITGRRNGEGIEEELYESIGIDVNFVQGVAQNAFSVRYDDAGIVSFNLSDSQIYSLPQQNNEQIDNENQRQKSPTQGELVMHVRPYTYAICDLNVVNPNDEYIQWTIGMAGAPIKAELRPVIWLDGDVTDSSNIIVTEEHCRRLTTTAFLHPDAPSAIVALDKTAKVLLPRNGSNGTLSGNLLQKNTEGVINQRTNRLNYQFTNFAIDEVGIFGFRSYAPNHYLGMKINQGELRVERFYPAYFDVVPSFKTGIPAFFDTEKEGFTYMNQGFEGGFTIYAMTADHQRVKNYHLLNEIVFPNTPPYKLATFSDFIAQQPPLNHIQMNNRWQRDKLANQWTADFNGSSQMRYQDNRMYIKKDQSPNGSAEFDGPFYPLDFAVKVEVYDNDGTDFRICGITDSFEGVAGCRQPVEQKTDLGAKIADMDIYYGRLVLKGFTEEGDLTKPEIIPAYVEYYDKNTGSFKTNERDNATYVTTEVGMSLKEIIKSDTDNPQYQAKIELIEGTPDDPGKPIVGKSRRMTKGVAPFLVTPYNPKDPDAPPPPTDGTEGPYREQFRFWQLLDGDPVPDPDPDPNPNPDPIHITPQPWLKFPWENSTIPTNPSAIGTYGFYTGHDKIIYRGEKSIRLVTGQ